MQMLISGTTFRVCCQWYASMILFNQVTHMALVVLLHIQNYHAFWWLIGHEKIKTVIKNRVVVGFFNHLFLLS